MGELTPGMIVGPQSKTRTMPFPWRRFPVVRWDGIPAASPASMASPDVLFAARSNSTSNCALTLCSVEHACGHREGYSGTARRTIGDSGGATVCPDNRIHEGKTQPVPERVLPSNETFKRPCPDLRRKSGAIVFDYQFR